MSHYNNDIDDSIYQSGTMLAPYLALPEQLNSPEDSPSLFFRLMLPLVAEYIYLPVLISFYFN